MIAMSTVYLNGSFVPKEQAKVSVFDHGYLYGDGVFEGIRAYAGRIFRLEEHIDRLYDSAQAICLNVPMTKPEMAEVCAQTCARNGIDDGYIRLVVSRGEGYLLFQYRIIYHFLPPQINFPAHDRRICIFSLLL